MTGVEFQVVINGENYNPRSKTNCIRNEEGITQEEINNTTLNKITLIDTKKINGNSFGIKGDNKTDNAEKLQQLINELHSKGGGCVYLESGRYNVSKTLKLYDDVTIEMESGNKSFLQPTVDGNYIKNYMILINSNDGVNADKPVSSKSSDAKEYQIFFNNRINIDENSDIYKEGIKGIFLSQSNCKFIRLSSVGFSNSITLNEKEYLDNVIIDTPSFISVHDFQIVKEGKGEALTILNPKLYESKEFGGLNWKLLKCKNTMNLEIVNPINGVIDIESSTFRIENAHIEVGAIITNNSDGTIQDFIIYPSVQKNHVLKLMSDNFSNVIELINGKIAYTPFQFKNGYAPLDYDMYCTVGNFYVRDVYRSMKFDDNVEQLTGIKIEEIKGSNFPTIFNKYSSQLSKECKTLDSNIVSDLIHYNERISGGGILQASIDISNPFNWSKTSMECHYKCQIIYGDEKHKLGIYQNDEAITTPSEGGKPVSLDVRFNNNSYGGMLRIFRGTISNVYDKYVDIPLIYPLCKYKLIDCGDTVNGFHWKDTNKTSVEISEELDSNIVSMRYIGIGEKGNKIIFMKNKPSKGSWNKGDRCYIVDENTNYFFNGSDWL